MYDRVSQNPGRVLITPEDGSGAFYATLALADNPTVVGTPLNAANLLSQATASLYGLGAAAVPDDVLAQARTLITAAQNTANTAMSKFNLSKIGTADISGMTVNTTGSITLSGNLRNYAEILMIFLDVVSASDTSVPYFEVTNLTPVIQYTSGTTGMPNPKIQLVGRDTDGVGFVHLQVPYNNADFAAMIGNSQGVERKTIYISEMAGLLSLPTSNTIEFSISGTSTFSSGTINVYGRKF